MRLRPRHPAPVEPAPPTSGPRGAEAPPPPQSHVGLRPRPPPQDHVGLRPCPAAPQSLPARAPQLDSGLYLAVCALVPVLVCHEDQEGVHTWGEAGAVRCQEPPWHLGCQVRVASPKGLTSWPGGPWASAPHTPDQPTLGQRHPSPSSSSNLRSGTNCSLAAKQVRTRTTLPNVPHTHYR